MHDMPCVILCGGKSSRMGEDKSLLPFSTYNSLAQFQYERLKPYFKKTYLSSKTEKFNFDTNLILDKEKEYSPIIALKSIFEYLNNFEKIFIITVDTPLVEISTINKIIKESINFDITVAKTEQKEHNLCGVFSSSCISYINNMLNGDIHRVGFLLKNMKTNFVMFENEDEFINLNDKRDYSKARLIIS